MDQSRFGFWPPVTPQVPQNYMRNTSQRCGVAGLMSGAYEGQLGIDVVQGLGALRGRVPVSLFAVQSPLAVGLHGLGDVCGTMTTTGVIGGALTSIWEALGLATSGSTGGAMRQAGRTASAGSAAFDAAVRGACLPSPQSPPTGYGIPSRSETDPALLALLQAQARAQAQASSDQAKALAAQKSNTTLLVGGAVVLAAVVGVALYLRR